MSGLSPSCRRSLRRTRLGSSAASSIVAPWTRAPIRAPLNSATSCLALLTGANGHMVQSHLPAAASDVVARAIADAEVLLRSTGATSGVDRVHTALHGYLTAACAAEGIAHPADASMAALLKVLRREHPRLQDLGPRPGDIERILNACGTIADALSPVRNRTSVAHPNKMLLPAEEAALVINAARTVLSYLSAKLCQVDVGGASGNRRATAS